MSKSSAAFRISSSQTANGTSLHHQVASSIGLMITEGALRPGSVLPNETDLSLRFSVSRTVLREATKVLASKRLIEVRRKTGTRVRPREEWNLLDPEVLGWLFSSKQGFYGVADLLEVRRLIEPAAARFAAERATPDDIEKIGKAFENMVRAVDDLNSSVESDLAFHLAILNAAHNAFLLPFGSLVRAALLASFRITSKDRLSYVRTLKLHRAVFNAISDGRGAKSEAAMLAVLSQTSADVAAQLTGESTALTPKRMRQRVAERRANG